MSALLDEETTVVELLDFDVPCVVGAAHGAEVFARCRKCREGAFLCRGHFEQARAEAMRGCADRRRALYCARCAAPTTSFDDLFEAVSI